MKELQENTFIISIYCLESSDKVLYCFFIIIFFRKAIQMKMSYFVLIFMLFNLILFNIASAAEDSLLYRIGYSDHLGSDLKNFGQEPESFIIDLVRSSDGTFVEPSDFSATCKIAWNDENLILFIDITDDDLVVSDSDDELWAHDCVELFLTPAVGSGGYYQLILAVKKDGTLHSRFYDFRQITDIPLKHTSSAVRTDRGYRIAARLPWPGLGIRPAVGTKIGMQIFADDSDPGEEMFQLQWYPHAHSHNSEWMHVVQLQQTTADRDILSCIVDKDFVSDSVKVDVYGKPDADLNTFDVLTPQSEIIGRGFLRNSKNGYKKAAILVPRTPKPQTLTLIANNRMAGKVYVGNRQITTADVMKHLQNLMIVPRHKWGYLFESGTRPEVMWSEPELVKNVTGTDTMQVSWFDRDLNEVHSFDKTGRYLAYAEAKLPDGRTIRRSATFYAISKDSHPWRGDTRIVLYKRTRPWWHPWRGRPQAAMEFIPGLGFDEQTWSENQTLLAPWAGKAFFDFLESDPYGPVLLGYLSEADKYAGMPIHTRTPEIINDDLHLALKRKLLEVDDTACKLKPPQNCSEKEGTALRMGNCTEAGFTEDAPQRIREVCNRWYADSGEPFAVLAARNGVIFFHEAFGKDVYGKAVTVETPMFMASVTKCMTAMMFGQLIDQGLADLDEPVGKYLPGFPLEGEKAITFRQCFTHTTGLKGHYEFGGMHNAWLENAIWLELPQLPVARVHEYNGMGYDLAGKAMEMITGKSAFRLMHENFFEPMGMNHTVDDDMASCTTSIPMDIAKMGQLILNGGCYNGKRFFGPETLAKLLPCELNQYYPAIHKNWGIGMTWMLTENPNAEKTGRKYLLSDRVVGHGAASSAIFRVDLKNKLLLVQTRGQAGRDYDKYLTLFLQTVDDTMIR